MYPLYKCEIVDIEGKTVEEIDDIISLQAARAFNTDGAATLVVPNTYKRDIFRLHTRMKLWRYDYRGQPLNFGDTVWFLKKIDNSISDRTITLSWVDAFAMFGTRLVAYTSLTPYADKTLEEFALVTYDDTLRLDNMMRAYARENFGSLALDIERLNTHISIEANKNLGPYGEKQAAWQELDSVLSDLAKQSAANGLPLYYDLIPEDNGDFIFRIWTRVRGIDRGSGASVNMVLNDTDGMIDEIHDIEDYEDVATVCYALGYDSGPSQVIERVESPLLLRNDPFSRIEMTINAADSDVPSVLRAEARAALNGRRPKHVVTAHVVENNALRYGDLVYGDLLSIEVAGRKYDVAVNAVSTRWDSQGEALDIHLMGEQFIGEIPTGGPTDPGVVVPGMVNSRPVADAGPDQEIESGATAILAGSGVDDGLPDPPAALTYKWTQVSGPETAIFDDDTSPTSSVTMAAEGEYVLRLTVSDSLLQDNDDMTITITSLPTVPPDMGLLDGVELVAGVGIDGYIYRTSDFQTPSGSGGPTWDRVDTTIPDTIYSWVVDPFSPGYIEAGETEINGWIVNDTDIYRIESLFGSPVATSVFTFSVATVAADFHWRTIQASFGAYFPSGENPWLVCVSYYGDTAGHEGTWATYSMDAGATWSTEAQIAANFDQGAADRFMPTALFTSPRTPGLAYTAAFASPALDTSKLPIWGIWDEETLSASYTGPQVSAEITSAIHLVGDTAEVVKSKNLFMIPPANTVRVVLSCRWEAQASFNGVGNPDMIFSYSLNEAATVGRSSTLAFDNPDIDPPNSDSNSQNFTVTWTYGGAGDWPVNRTSIIGTPITGGGAPDGCRFIQGLHGNGTAGTEDQQGSIFTRATITEIEFDGGIIYNPPVSASDGFISEDWGATWTALGGVGIDPGQGVAGTIHVPWPDNEDEQLIYYGNFDRTTNREFRLKRAQGASITDISPNDGTRSYGVHRGPFGVRTYDSDRLYALAAVMGNDVDALPANDKHAVYISDDNGDTWTQVVAPMADSGAPTNRPAFEAAFAGDTEQVLFIWGPPNYISYSSNFGVSVDSRAGNLSSFGVPGFVGIAGGAS